MKAAEFAYECPQTLSEALALLSEEGVDTRPIAGGQSLMPMMNFRLSQPERLLDLNRIADLSFVREAGAAVEIGAMTRLVDLGESSLVSANAPLIEAALPHIAHPAIRNRGTIGGSVALADPAAELPAVLLALGAQFHVAAASGERVIDAADFFLGPYETELAPHEILRMISVPKGTPEQKTAFHEVARRHGDYAMAGVAVAVNAAERASDIRIAFFGVSDRPVRAPTVEAALRDQALDDPKAIDAAIARVEDVDFHGDLHAGADTKRHLAKVVLKRALTELSR